MKLQPKDLGITNKKIKLSQLKTQVSKALSKNKELNRPTKAYLDLLIDYFHKPDAKIEKKIASLYETNKKELASTIAAVKTDFGEVLGGMACLSQKLMKTFFPSVNFSNGEIFYPPKQNEPLTDYSIFVGKTQYNISAKIAGGTSNPVKPQDIITLIDNSKVIPKDRLKAIKNSLEYNLLKILGENSTLLGSGLALCTFKEKASQSQKTKMEKYVPMSTIPSVSDFMSEFEDINTKINTQQYTSKIYSGKKFDKMISSAAFKNYAKTHQTDLRRVTWADLVLFFEYVIEKSSKDKSKAIDIGDLFIDAITSQVYYVKLDFNTKTGLPEFEVMASVRQGNSGKTISNFKAEDLFIRSKSSKYKDGRYRLKDKIGVQT